MLRKTRRWTTRRPWPRWTNEQQPIQRPTFCRERETPSRRVHRKKKNRAGMQVWNTDRSCHRRAVAARVRQRPDRHPPADRSQQIPPAHPDAIPRWDAPRSSNHCGSDCHAPALATPLQALPALPKSPPPKLRASLPPVSETLRQSCAENARIDNRPLHPTSCPAIERAVSVE